MLGTPVIDRQATRSRSVNMNYALALLVVFAVGTLADQSQYRTKKDIVPATKKKLCVLADVSKTGKKTVVCGDAAPPTLDMLLAEKLENAVTAIGSQDRQPDAKAASAKCDLKPKPLKVYVQQPEHHHELSAYVLPQVQQYVQPPVQYVQPPVQYVQPQVHYQQPQVHVVQPQVHVVEPQVHIMRPQVHYEQAQVQYAQPTKSLCPTYEQNGGYGGSYYGRSAIDGYPTMVRTVDPDLLVDDVPVMRTADIAAIPFDQPMSARDSVDYDTIDARRFAPAAFRSVMMRNAPDLSYGYDGQTQQMQMQQQPMQLQQMDVQQQQQQYPMSSFGRVPSQQRSFDAILPQTVQQERMDDGMRRQYGYSVQSESMMPYGVAPPMRAAGERTGGRMLSEDGAAALDDSDEATAGADTKSVSDDAKNVKQLLYGGAAAAKTDPEDAKTAVEHKKIG